MYNTIMKSDERDKFGENLYRIRRGKGYTQHKLAELSGVSQRAIAHIEKYSKRPTIDKVKKLSQALGISDEELLGVTKIKVGSIQKDNTSYRIMKRVRIIEKLPKRDQDVIFSLINSLAEKNKLKGNK